VNKIAKKPLAQCNTVGRPQRPTKFTKSIASSDEKRCARDKRRILLEADSIPKHVLKGPTLVLESNITQQRI
jgi:hypothetical protein